MRNEKGTPPVLGEEELNLAADAVVHDVCRSLGIDHEYMVTVDMKDGRFAGVSVSCVFADEMAVFREKVEPMMDEIILVLYLLSAPVAGES